jgi:hypothetical protein
MALNRKVGHHPIKHVYIQFAREACWGTFCACIILLGTAWNYSHSDRDKTCNVNYKKEALINFIWREANRMGTTKNNNRQTDN